MYPQKFQDVYIVAQNTEKFKILIYKNHNLVYNDIDIVSKNLIKEKLSWTISLKTNKKYLLA